MTPDETMPTATTRMSGSTGSNHNDVSPHMAPSIISSPWAKWMMLVARMIIAKPRATRLYTQPTASPPTSRSTNWEAPREPIACT